MLEYLDKKLPFAIPVPLPSDLLPSDDGTRNPVSQGRNMHEAPPGIDSGKLGVYARIAQAAVLLSYVINRLTSSGPFLSSCSAANLDQSLRSFAMTLLHPDENDHLCSPYGICLRLVLFPVTTQT